MVTVLNIAGARPNYMKIAPIHRAMVADGRLCPRFLHTGQHYDWEMSQVFLRDLGLPDPDHELNVGSGSHGAQTATVMLRLEPILRELRPEAVVVVGDVNSTLAAALTAVKLHIPVAHVEAGLRSFDRSMPEEINRLVTDAVAEVLFPPSKDAVENLLREGVPGDRIHLVGNVMIDSLDALLPLTTASDALHRLRVNPGKYLLATVHRPANVDRSEALTQVVRILVEASDVLPLLLPAHPRTRKRLTEYGLIAEIDRSRVRLIEPLGYVDFLKLMSSAAAVLTDSGGVQEETTVLGVPCLTLRDTTERPVTVTEGTNQVVGLDRARIMSALHDVTRGRGPETRRPALWDGHAAERIVNVLADLYG